MSKYIIKNCPACCLYGNKYGCEDNHDEQGRDTYCELIDDCVMKQIVEKCLNGIDFTIFKAVDGCYSERGILVKEILGLLDIQEVE